MCTCAYACAAVHTCAAVHAYAGVYACVGVHADVCVCQDQGRTSDALACHSSPYSFVRGLINEPQDRQTARKH